MSRQQQTEGDVENVLAVDAEDEQADSCQEKKTSLAKIDAEFNVPQHMATGTISRHFILSWDNTLAGLSSFPEQAEWKPSPANLSIFQSRTRYAPGCRKSAVRQGNLSSCIMVGMKIKKVESTFPCQLGLKVTGAKGNFYTSNGERYAYLIGNQEQSHKLDEIVVTTNPYVNSEYLRLYPGMTSDKLRSEGIMSVPGENYVFVDKRHPIVEMMVSFVVVIASNCLSPFNECGSCTHPHT